MRSQKHVGALRGCQLCSSKNLRSVLPLGHQPIVQNYLSRKQLNEPETTYPLNLYRCRQCGLLQLNHVIDPTAVFPRNYLYRTGLTNALIKNFGELADTLEKKYALKPNDLIVDIGSNDGTLLQGFKKKGMRVMGVEPTNAAKDAVKNGIPTIQDFFSEKTVRAITGKYGPARIVTATNVFAHINDVPRLARNIGALMAKDGIFVSESQYFLDTFKKLEFDCVYHEHLRFYTLKPLAKVLSLSGLTMVDVEKISTHGGSIRVYAAKGAQRASPRIRTLIAAEEKAGLYDEHALRNFAKRIQNAKHDLVSLVLACRKKGRVVGVGSPARSNTLLGYTGIDCDILDYVFEKNGSPKIGFFTPGTHIPVVDEKYFLRDRPEYALVLSWHLGNELMKKLRELGYTGKFIVPLPKPHVASV